MTAMNLVADRLERAVGAVADATSGLGGVVTAPLAPNRTVSGDAKRELDKFLSGVFDLGVIPPVLVVWMLYTGGDDKSFARRLGEGVFAGITLWLALEVARGVLL